MIEIEQIKQALAGATPAPWMRKDNEVWTVKTDKDDYHTQIVKKTRSIGFEHDLDLIANVPTWLASLITAIESLQAENKELLESEIFVSYQNVILDNASLKQEINTLEAEVESLQDAFEMLPAKDVEIHERTQIKINETVSRLLIESLQKDLESQKTITELAVKGLEKIREGEYWNPEAYQDFASDTLDEIERLTHEN